MGKWLPVFQKGHPLPACLVTLRALAAVSFGERPDVEGSVCLCSRLILVGSIVPMAP